MSVGDGPVKALAALVIWLWAHRHPFYGKHSRNRKRGKHEKEQEDEGA